MAYCGFGALALQRPLCEGAPKRRSNKGQGCNDLQGIKAKPHTTSETTSFPTDPCGDSYVFSLNPVTQREYVVRLVPGTTSYSPALRLASSPGAQSDLRGEICAQAEVPDKGALVVAGGRRVVVCVCVCVCVFIVLPLKQTKRASGDLCTGRGAR